jgi:glutamate-ammonia-ligase adenylyltransferase
LGRSASPERALTNFTRWLGSIPRQAEDLRHLEENPRTLEMLITLLAGSQFLSGILLRHPDYFNLLLRPDLLARKKPPEEFMSEAEAATGRRNGEAPGAEAALDSLRCHQQRELLRIGVADLCGLLDLSSVTAQLSHLADAVVGVGLTQAGQRTGVAARDFAVLALGKLGGVELNYSSDIDLLFLATRDVTAYERLGRELIKILTQATGEGFLYRVDMRLRPWGRAGPLVPTLAGYQAYLEQHARLWEKQALLKARAVAGDEGLGREALALPWRNMGAEAPAEGRQEAVRAGILAMKQMTEAELRRQGREWGEVKLGKGSIRDVEFVAQYLQLVHGPDHPEVLCGNTLGALDRLAQAGLLPQDDQRVLVEGYIFLRTVEHHLQLLEYRQTNTLPAHPAELAYLAQRLGFHGPDAAAGFIERYQAHSAAVRAIFRRHLGANAMNAPANTAAEQPSNGVRKHRARMAPSYGATFSEAEIRSHAVMVERLTDDRPVEVAAIQLDDRTWRATIVAYDYPGELSLICGLLFVHGFSIIDGHVYTYEAPRGQESLAPAERRAKIVDVFRVRPVSRGGYVPRGDAAPGRWSRYAEELSGLLRLLSEGRQREAQGKLANAVALALAPSQTATSRPVLHPIDLEIDNDSSDRYTVLRIRAHDTPGFLYEFTNALALTGIYISEVTVDSAGRRLHDVLYVTDGHGHKLTSPDRLRELRATVVLIKHFTHLLPLSPNPQAALLHFHAYLGELLRRPTWPDELASLERPEVLQALARLLGVSDFLWEDFLRMQYANLFPVMRDMDALASARGAEQRRSDLAQALAAAPDGNAARAALNAFKDREMFRSDMRYILGHTPGFDEFAAELTDVAEIALGAACDLCDGELRERYGEPRLDDGRLSGLSLCALGRCGGRELGFASDVELIFVYAGNGLTAGPASITTAEYYEKLVQSVVQAIRAKREGIFGIDLQLRPYGSAGSLAVSLASFRHYFAQGGPAWEYERQALIKLRPIAGDAALGRQVATLRDEFVYGGQEPSAAAARAMRERQIRHLVTPGTFNAKFSLGGLVDVEYFVQRLQMSCGRHEPRVRTTNTVAAMAALAEVAALAPDEVDFLRRAHGFLRRLIEAMRMVRGNAKDLTVPAVDSEEFAFLARRLGYDGDLARLSDDLTAYTAGVRRLSSR